MLKLSEIPYLAINEKLGDFKKSDDNVFSGTGRIVAPFTMVDVSNQQQFKSLGYDYHVYCSWLPLYDGCYWFFVLHAKISNALPALIYQFLEFPISQFEFYYLKTKKPLRYRQLNMFDRQLPFTADEVQRQTGIIDGVNLIDLQDTESFTDLEKRFNKFIDSNQTDNLIRLSYGEMLGVDGI